jgi:hypothetical protein
MFFILWIIFINFIWMKFRIETDRGSGTQWHIPPLSRDSFNRLLYCVDCIWPWVSDLSSRWQFLSWVWTIVGNLWIGFKYWFQTKWETGLGLAWCLRLRCWPFRI